MNKLESNHHRSSLLKSIFQSTGSFLKLKLTNQKLEEKNKQWKTLNESMAEGMVYQDATGQIIEFNSAACAVLGLTPDQLLGRTSFDPRWKAVKENGEDFPGAEHPAIVSLSTGKTLRNIIMGIRLPDQTLRWISINSTPIFDHKNSNPTHVVCTFNDVTEEKKLLHDIKLNEMKFVALFENAPIGMLELDENLNILESNQAFSEITGYSREELRKMSTVDITHPDDIQQSLDQRQFPSPSLEYFNRFRKRYLKKNGETVWVQIISRKYLTHRQETHFFSTVEDISAQIKLENAVKEQESKLLQASKMSSLGEMAAGMAHEINNPLAIILASANLAKKQLKDSADRPLDLKLLNERMEKIESTVDRIAKIVKGLRSFARNADQDEKTPVLFSQVIEDTLSLCQEKFKHSSIELRIHQQKNALVLGRPSQLSQVMLNLLSNSYDSVYHQPGAWIDILTKRDNHHLIITVTDSGNGIPKEIQAKLMQPFFTTKEIGKGTGLGLSISQGIILEHGGKFYYDSNSQNTRFVIELPIYEKQNIDS